MPDAKGRAYQVLGIHGANPDDPKSWPSTARVRMFLDDERIIDEDFGLPPTPPGVTPSADIYEYLLAQDITRRMQELQSSK